MLKVDRLVRTAGRIGFDGVLASLARRPGLLVLAYHRIGEADGQFFDDELFSATADGFRDQLRYLARHFSVLDASAVLKAMRGGRLELDTPSALVTFDDGYRDNCEVALPILRELGLPAVFFIAAGYVDSPRLTWWDRVAYVVKHTTRTKLTLSYPAPETFDLAADGPALTTQRILRAYKRTPQIDPVAFFERLEHSAEVHVDSTVLGRELFMTWAHVRALSAAGMEIGAHTYDHPVLANVSAEEQRRELKLSKTRLEQELSGSVRMMSYPVGGPAAFSPATKTFVREAGYEAAFSYYGGFNGCDNLDPQDIRRIPVERTDTLASFSSRASLSNLLPSLR